MPFLSYYYFRFIGRHCYFLLSADIGQCRDQFQWVGNGRKCGRSHWNFVAISFHSWVITTSGLPAAIAISGCRLDVGRHQTTLEIAPACWAWSNSKMFSIRWNFVDILCRYWVNTTSGLLAAIAISCCRPTSAMPTLKQPSPKIGGSRWNFVPIWSGSEVRGGRSATPRCPRGALANPVRCPMVNVGVLRVKNHKLLS
jgi:hypothetical protein